MEKSKTVVPVVPVVPAIPVVPVVPVAPVVHFWKCLLIFLQSRTCWTGKLKVMKNGFWWVG